MDVDRVGDMIKPVSIGSGVFRESRAVSMDSESQKMTKGKGEEKVGAPNETYFQQQR